MLFDNQSKKENTAEKIVVTSTLERQFALNKFCDTFKQLAPNCKEVIIIERIVDVDDSFTNALQFILDRSHVRFYTVQEIVSEFSKNFFMKEYNVYAEQINIDKSILQSAEAIHILNNITDRARKFINFTEETSSINMKKIFAEFRFIMV